MRLVATRAVPPRRRAYAEVVVLGAHATAMWRRLDLVDRSRVVALTLTVLVAPRPTAREHPRHADGIRDELLGPGGRFPAAPGWSPPGTTGSVARRHPLPITTEAHLALLLLSRRWRLDVAAALDRLEDPSIGVRSVELELGGTAAFGTVMLRRVGCGVPGTTAGTLADWAAARRADPASGTGASAAVGPRLIVTSRPHLLRTRRVVAGTLGPASDVEVAAAPGPDHLTPTLLRLLVRAERGSRPLAGLRLVGGGGEAMRWTDVAAAAPILGPDSRVLHGYGATEVGAVARLVIDPSQPLGRGVVPVGRPVPGRRVDVVVGTDAAGDRGAAAVGELLVTREDLGVGPVLTGDLGRRDADGVLHLVGRADRMVKVGGVRVEPAALEAALAEVDGVADAAVVAVPDEDVGVRLVAHVHVIARSGADAGRLTAHVRALGPPGADGLRVVRRDAPLPLLASGKPDLRHLAAG